MPYPGWSPKMIRMYKHIKDSSGSKSIAAATVNKFKSKKKKHKRSHG
jgi:hypothetical protein